MQTRRRFLQGTASAAAAAGAAGAAAADPISIDTGRQLFVDDYLIAEQSHVHRTFHKPHWYENNPILRPETPVEMNDGVCPVAAPFNDGVCYDPKDRLFKMWYHAGWFTGVGYAISEDGLKWRRPTLDVEPGTNLVLPLRKGYQRDGCLVWLDHAATDPQQRYKMFVYFRHRKDPSVTPPANYWKASGADWDWESAEVRTSPDGIHWSEPAFTGPLGDNSGIFYHPFRKSWMYTIRVRRPRGRSRAWREAKDLIAGAQWKPDWSAKGPDINFWLSADDLDLPDSEMNWQPELYDVDAAPYESLMLGQLAIFKGFREKGGPKTNDLTIAFMRGTDMDWIRPDRTPFLACSRQPGTWNRAYLHCAGGICLVVGEKLYFYFGAWSGISPKRKLDVYAGGSTGVAMLRRDGFASMDGPPVAIPSSEPAKVAGSITTHPVVFRGRYLFVNVNTVPGEVRVEVLDREGRPIAPFTLENCVAITGKDSTKVRVRWQQSDDVRSLSGQAVRFRFQMKGAQLYAFWVSPEESGASFGYVAAGGPGFPGGMDTTGA
jgi:hypothetical protein